MTTKERYNFLKSQTIYGKCIKKSFLKRTCHVCGMDIIKEDYYKVKTYDKHQRCIININVCYNHGKDLEVYNSKENLETIKQMIKELDEMSKRSKAITERIEEINRKIYGE